MADASLLEVISFVGDSKLSSLKWNHKLQCFPAHVSFRLIKNNARCIRTSILSVKCVQKSKKWTTALVYEEKNWNPFEAVMQAVMKVIRAFKKPAIAAIFLGFLLMYDPHPALGYSGGRMGGQAFSSHSSSSSRRYSAETEIPSFSYSLPYYEPRQFGGGGLYAAPALGVGAGSGSKFFMISMGFVAFILVSGFFSERSENGFPTVSQKTSVLKLQVGLLGMARTLQRDLCRIAETADTSTPDGLSYVLTETTLSLLCCPDYCISGYSFVDVKQSVEDGEKRFNQLSIEERGKFDEETLVNVNNIKKKSRMSQSASGFSNEYIVITVLVAAEDIHKLPIINSSADLKEALLKLASISFRKTMAVEVLWAPQDENDILSQQELVEDYPLLRPL